MTYFRMDDSSDTETLTTKNKEVQIKGLASGKTYELRVSCEVLIKLIISIPVKKSSLSIEEVGGGGGLVE